MVRKICFSRTREISAFIALFRIYYVFILNMQTSQLLTILYLAHIWIHPFNYLLAECQAAYILTRRNRTRPRSVASDLDLQWLVWPLSVNYVCQGEFICISQYSRLSLSRIPRDSLKHFKISVPRNISVSEVRKTLNRTTTFNKWICNLTPEARDILKILWERGKIAL